MEFEAKSRCATLALRLCEYYLPRPARYSRLRAGQHGAQPYQGKRMPNIPYLMANAGVEFHRENLFGGSGQNTRLFADVAFVEEYFYDFEMTQLQKRRIPRSTTLDIGFEHSFLNNKLFISGKLRNVTNEKTLSEFNRPLPGINGGVKLRVIF